MIPIQPSLAYPYDGQGKIGNCGVVLSWHRRSGAISYNVQVSTDPQFGTLFLTASLTDTFQTITGLENSRTYYWRVSASNYGGTSAWSAVWRFYTFIYHLAGNINTPGNARGVAVSGTRACVCDDSGVLSVFNVAIPAAPQLIGSYMLPAPAYDLEIAGDNAYVADGDSGLRIVDISDPSNPHEIGCYDTPGIAYQIAIQGNYAYIADGQTGGLRIVDISNPTAPSLAGQHNNGVSYYSSIKVNGNYAYVTGVGYYEYYYIYDISNPTFPTIVNSVYGLGSMDGIAFSNNRMYVSSHFWKTGQKQCVIYDNSIPTNPTSIATVPNISFGHAHIAGNYIFAADGVVYAIIDIAIYCEVARYSIASIFDMCVINDYEYLACWSNGFRILQTEH